MRYLTLCVALVSLFFLSVAPAAADMDYLITGHFGDLTGAAPNPLAQGDTSFWIAFTLSTQPTPDLFTFTQDPQDPINDAVFPNPVALKYRLGDNDVTTAVMSSLSLYADGGFELWLYDTAAVNAPFTLGFNFFHPQMFQGAPSAPTMLAGKFSGNGSSAQVHMPANGWDPADLGYLESSEVPLPDWAVTASVPEPSSIVLLGTMLACACGVLKRRWA